MTDQIDLKILSLLKTNSRMQWKDIGRKIHMTGQAVGNRIRKMEDEGTIKSYTILVDDIELGKNCLAFITVFMKSNAHAEFLKFIASRDYVIEAHRISGDGCYLLKVLLASHSELDHLLTELLPFGNYRLSLSINKVK